eukprot:CAMPEP_0181319864 /NCGR_PEP_ID=MMETSP1101-20121128/17805_1 /TAXON_ID=46948 /ORGANISM="Rhodomonas abbreviata, Strain Caron Lab Isolate" /LENGTH=337 /DNA_ID=CAMNT_0023427505 /DNA_START=30 /DNA_END=1044 /DNA_ORIENTATION=+
MREEEREKAEAEIRNKETALRKEREEREKLANQLKAMEEKVVKGTADQEQAKAKEEELIKAQVELEERRAEQEKLNQQLREKEELSAAAEEKFSSVQEEAAAKTKKLKKLWSRYEHAKSEVKDLQGEFQAEKEDLLDTIRDQDRQIKLLSLIVSSFVPPEERKKVERRARWEDDVNEWTVENPSTIGATAKRPVSAVTGAKRPSSAVARTANRLGSENPRFKGENIIQLELDMPERTTRDYQDRDLLPDGDLLGMAMPTNPNVYFSFPSQESPTDSFAPTSSSASSSSSSSSRPKSRATSNGLGQCRRGGQPVARGEAPAEAPQEDFPSARGLVPKR